MEQGQIAVIQEPGPIVNLVSKNCRPPKKFRPSGRIESARWETGAPNFAANSGRGTDAQRAGINFENKIQLHLITLYESYWPSPWLKFRPRSRSSASWRWCQPDGLLIDIRRGSCTIVEIKLSHTVDAWWQLEKLYRPVVEKLMGKNWEIRTIEICKNYDPDTVLPGCHELVDSIYTPPYIDKMNVLVWREGDR